MVSLVSLGFKGNQWTVGNFSLVLYVFFSVLAPAMIPGAGGGPGGGGAPGGGGGPGGAGGPPAFSKGGAGGGGGGAGAGGGGGGGGAGVMEGGFELNDEGMEAVEETNELEPDAIFCFSASSSRILSSK